MTMCELNLTPPMMTGRVNRTKTNREECLEILRAEGFEVEASTCCAGSYSLSKRKSSSF